ncbi:TrkH family potassium uptake protein [Loktanella sp. SALINAS62]|uniref:TrkH family potassium uptake protein n=1 Tax=Loktanella sp. SALINAS62 TaxID=2706124 RepID=UPI001B8CD9CD|nr:TrkH family potassium uptake protein [Loktanella sp. SALINAS62]MBS1303392.1 TrkH family potassium uptake protein [Loktanella sp. SALINAS62]
MKQAPVLSAVVLPPCLVSAALGSWGLFAALAPQSAVLLAISVTSYKRPAPKFTRRIEAVVLFATLFLLACLISTPPFLALRMSPLNAFFEATSGITSTGLSVARDATVWPVAAHLLRGWLQWCGGFALAFAGLTILHDHTSALRELGQSTLEERDKMTSMRKHAQLLLAFYGALTGVAVAGCLFLLPTWWEGVSIALASVSTGGFTPQADSLASYSVAAQVFVMGICVMSSVSFLFYIMLWRAGFRKAIASGHVVLYIGVVCAGTLLYAFVSALLFPDTDATVIEGSLNFISGLTTAGFSAAPVSSSPLLVVLLLVGMVIGGDIGSTSGGMKIGRIAVAIQMVRLSFHRLLLPTHGVLHLRDRGKRQTSDDITAAGAVLVLYIATVLICWSIFLAASQPALPALFEVVSAVSTVGLSSGITAPDLPPHLVSVLLVAMLLGRLEFIALIAIFLPKTWIRGRYLASKRRQ